MLKAAGNNNTTTLTLFNDIWQKESLSQQWKKLIIVKLPQKGDLTDCNNWCRITLLSVPSKLNQINTLRTIIEESLEY